MALTKAQREVWKQLEPDGWEQRGYDGSGGLVVAHPRVNGYLSLHGTPGDHRHAKNLTAAARRMVRQSDHVAGKFLDWMRARHEVPDDGKRRVEIYLQEEIAAYLDEHAGGGTPASIAVSLTKVRPWIHAIKQGGPRSKSVYEIAGPHADLPVTLPFPIAPPADDPAAPDVNDAEANGVSVNGEARDARSLPGDLVGEARRANGNGNGHAGRRALRRARDAEPDAAAAEAAAAAPALQLVSPAAPGVPGVPAMPPDDAREAWHGIAGNLAAALHPHIAAERDLAIQALQAAERALAAGLGEARAALDMLLGADRDGPS